MIDNIWICISKKETQENEKLTLESDYRPKKKHSKESM